MATMKASQTGQLYWTTGSKKIMPAAAIIEPTDRSNSPPIISMVAPMPMMPSWAETSSQVRKPIGVRKPLSPATMVKRRKMMIAPATAPSSGRPRILRITPTCWTRSS